MKSEYFTGLSDQELLQKMKKLKTDKIVDAAIIGLTIGIAIYSVVQKVFGFFTFFPLIIGYLIIKNSKNNEILYREMEKELESRNSKKA
ncbi:FUSC family protein [Flavobacterium sp. WG21]|uniref:FUSC family protein n=1 Tax=Flavobacterium sp. WG21 TaxID=1229487 RepID=UPI0003465B0C|nr:FUSC family protein [Flavobacterium sp. WG21]